MIGRLRRVPQVAGAVRAARALEAHDGWDAERLATYQRERLLGLIRHAAVHSPYYRERFAGVELAEDLDVTALPTLDKAAMLDHFDELVTDRRLTLAGVETHVAEVERLGEPGDPLLLGEYRAMASGGTTGRRGVFVYGRRDWTQILGGFLRWTGSYLGLPPRVPRRRRIAGIAADSPLHMTGRFARSLDVGMHRMLRLDARAPLADQREALDRFRPEALIAYPSVAALLADEQLAGRLRIAPKVVATTSEVRTAEMEERIVAAWGRAPFNGYASTETGFLASDCDRHAGLHVFGDLAHVEVVDDDRRPVPAGTPGSRILVTNLVNGTQPLIRFELTDLVTVSPEPCPCGRPHPVLESVDGRSDDVLRLPASTGGTVAVHPLTIRAPLGGVAALREYCVVHDADGLHVRAVLTVANGDAESTRREIEGRLRGALAEQGVEAPPITVESVDDLPRHPGSGKRKLIESRNQGTSPIPIEGSARDGAER